MATEIDALQIEISAKAQKANQSIDALVSRLDVLSKSLGKINTGSANLLSLGRGVDYLSRGMQGFKGVGEAKFVKLANGINQLANINSQGINNAARALSHIAASFDRVSGMQGKTAQVADLARSLGRLGGVNVQRAIANIPQLTTAMNNLMNTLSRSPMVSQNIIDMTNALANLAGQGSRVGSASNSISRSLNKTSSSATRAKKSFGGLASAIGKFYATYFLIVRAIKGLGRSIESTADYVEAFNYFNVALGKIGSDWSHEYEKYGYSSAEAYADSFSTRLREKLSSLSGLKVSLSADGSGLLTETGLKNLGLNIKEITQYASQLASVTNSVGQTGEVSLAAASSFTKLGADISSLFNLDYSQVMQNLQSGLIGQSRALYRYGIDITNATLQTYAYELGLSKAVSEMTQAEKMQLRMIAILDQSRVSWGDLANTINSPSNMLRQFTNNLREVGMVLGQLFIPLMERVMPVVNGATIAIKNFLVNLATLLGVNIDFSAFGQGFTDLGEDSDELAGGLDNIASSAKKANAGLRKFDELNNITSSNGISGSLGDLGNTIDLTEEIIKATEKYETAWAKAYEKMQNDAEDFANRFEKIFKRIRDLFKPITNPFKDLDWETITKNITDFGKAIAPYADSFGTGFINFFGDLSEISADNIEYLFGEDGAITYLTDWLNKNDPQRAEKWGYSLGVLLTGLLGFSTLKKLVGLGDILKKNAKGLSSLAPALALFIPLETFFQTRTESGAVKYLESLEKIKTLDFNNMKLPDWLNAAKELFLATAGMSGKPTAQAKSVFSLPIPKEEDFATLEEYQAALDEYKNTVAEIAYGKDLEDRIMNNELVRTLFSKTMYRQLSKDATGEVVKSFEEMEEPINSVLDNITDKLKEMRKLIPAFSFGTGFFVKPNFQSYSTGGFPEDGLFMANHNELVGQFSNGKTAVANNQQITQGIADAVYPAVYNAIVAGIGNSGIGGSSLRVEGDPRGMFRVFVDEWNNEARRTQNNPVIIYK